jgi:saccharopine dehydrogenase-like NADP-dependent oxidoreductase
MGQVIVRDLSESEPVKSVVIADFDKVKAEGLKAALNSRKVSAEFADIKDSKALISLLSGATAVINSTPYYFNLQVMEAAAEAGCHYLDLGGLFHVTRQQQELDSKFKQRNLLAVLGMGAAPGMTNVMAQAAVHELDTVESIDIAVGCIDFAETDHPLYPPYALDTLLDEYTKEPMVFEQGEFLAKPAMSGEIMLDFPQPVGQSKAFYTLHSEVATLPKSYASKGVKKVTFRLGLPKEFHERLQFLVKLGFGSNESFCEETSKLSARQVLARMLDRFPAPAGDPCDCEVVRVDVKGQIDGGAALVRLETTVRSYDRWKVSCGALDTGVPPSIVAQMIALGQIKERGVLAPELCVPAQPFFDELSKRSIVVRKILERSLVRQQLVSGR